MLDKSFGLFFYLKKRSGYQKGDVPIYLRITVDGVSTELSVKEIAILNDGLLQQEEQWEQKKVVGL